MSTPVAVHCCVSIARFVEEHKLTSGETAILQALWMRSPDPWAAQPTVRTSYCVLSTMTGLAQRSCENATRRLVNVGALRKGGSAKGIGTAYTLLRPEHDPSDAELDPYTRPVASTVVGEAIRESGREMTRAIVEAIHSVAKDTEA